MARNHVWRYTLRLFHTFAILEKTPKINAKMVPKIIENWLKIRPGGDQWSLILRFLAFWSDAKNT